MHGDDRGRDASLPRGSGGRLPRGVVQPELTGLQFLVLRLLFDGPCSARRLRAELAACNVGLSRSGLSQLMRRLESRRLVHGQSETLATGRQQVRFRVYRATISGARAWRRTRSFYARFLDVVVPRDRLFDDARRRHERRELTGRLIELADAYLRKTPPPGGRSRG